MRPSLRLIHTSDWHLGQTLHNFERGFEHQCFLDWLVATLVTEQADCLLISGDIFDNANPSASSQKQWYSFLQTAKAQLPALDMIVIAGNHDSAGRLEAPGPLLDAMGIRVVGQVPRCADGTIDIARLVVPLHDANGLVAAWCLAIPFLRPGDVPRVAYPDADAVIDIPAATSITTSADTGTDESGTVAPVTRPCNDPNPYMDGIALLYQEAIAHALTLRQPGQALVAMGHCHMVGGSVSEQSERRIVIGGTEALSATIFGPEIAYAALGHLHLAQSVGKQAHLRYCGSPIPLSFSEVGYQHQVLRVDLEGAVATAITALPIPRSVQLLRVPAKPAPLKQVLDALTQLDLPSSLHAALPDSAPYLEVRVILDAPEPGLRALIEAVLELKAAEGKVIRLAKIETGFTATTGQQGEEIELDELERLQPDTLFQRLYRAKYGAEAPEALCAALHELMLSTELP